MMRRMPSRAYLLIVALAVVLLVGAVPLALGLFDGDGNGRGREPGPSGSPARDPKGERVFSFADPVERACAMERKILVRLWRGIYGNRAGDLMLVPQRPNYSGGFVIPGHTGPWDYLQKVPLVLYGPGRIAARGEVTRPANITDVFSTVGALTGVGLPERDGRLLREALTGADGVPKLVVTIVWDGVGNNVLARWPDRTPTLRRLMEQGTSYTNASVGSSPSITPATHANLGTGSYPRAHGITAINMRRDNGELISAMVGRDPRDLERTTYADEIDVALGNEPKVGMVAWKSWHMTMLGHGTQMPRGDADELALIGFGEGDITGSPEWYSTPSYLEGLAGLRRHARRVDREDGEADGRWMGHDVLEMHDNPAWIRYEGDIVLEMLRRGAYGSDDVPDLFFTNFKVTDIVGHQYTMASEEMGAVLEEQDAQLARILAYLDRAVGDYAVVLTSDHGHTPPWTETGGWPIVISEVKRDIDAHFDVPEGRSLIGNTSPAGLFFDYETIEELGVSREEMARVVNDYTIRDNWPKPELPEGFAERGHEHVFSAGFLRTQLPEIMRCAFGSKRPPPGFPA